MTDKIDPISVGAIGYREDMTDEQLAGKHVDSLSGLVFDTEEAYCNHKSPITGFKPTELEHQGERFKAVSEQALKRGEAKKEAEAESENKPGEIENS